MALRKVGTSIKEIRKLVRKKDGKKPSKRAIMRVLEKAQEDPEWRGDDSAAGGRPGSLSTETKKELVDLVVKERGSHVVTRKFCQKRIPALRKVSKDTVGRALHEAGLAWLRRRAKRAVPKTARVARVKYAKALLLRRSFKGLAFTDGTTFYLARSAPEAEDKPEA